VTTTTLTVREALYRVADAIAKHETRSPHPMTESALRRLCGETVTADFDAAVDAILDGPGSDADHDAALSALSDSNMAVLYTAVGLLIPNPNGPACVTAAQVRAIADIEDFAALEFGSATIVIRPDTTSTTA
jgi:hypothetical protein